VIVKTASAKSSDPNLDERINEWLLTEIDRLFRNGADARLIARTTIDLLLVRDHRLGRLEDDWFQSRVDRVLNGLDDESQRYPIAVLKVFDELTLQLFQIHSLTILFRLYGLLRHRLPRDPRMFRFDQSHSVVFDVESPYEFTFIRVPGRSVEEEQKRFHLEAAQYWDSPGRNYVVPLEGLIQHCSLRDRAPRGKVPTLAGATIFQYTQWLYRRVQGDTISNIGSLAGKSRQAVQKGIKQARTLIGALDAHQFIKKIETAWERHLLRRILNKGNVTASETTEIPTPTLAPIRRIVH